MHENTREKKKRHLLVLMTRVMQCFRLVLLHDFSLMRCLPWLWIEWSGADWLCINLSVCWRFVGLSLWSYQVLLLFNRHNFIILDECWQSVMSSSPKRVTPVAHHLRFSPWLVVTSKECDRITSRSVLTLIKESSEDRNSFHSKHNTEKTV